MPWNPPTAEIEGIIDGNLKSSPPAPPQSNSAASVRSLLKNMWGAMAGGVSAAVNSIDAVNANLVSRSLNLTATVYVDGLDGNDARTGETNNNHVTTGCVKTLTRVAELFSGKTQQLTVIMKNTVTVSNDVTIKAPILILSVQGGTLVFPKLTVTDGNSVNVGEGTRRIVCISNQVFVSMVYGAITVEGHAGSTGAGDQSTYRGRQGAICLAKDTPGTAELFPSYGSLNLYVWRSNFTLGTNTLFAASGANGKNNLGSRQDVYSRVVVSTPNTITIDATAQETNMIGDRVFMRQYHPTSSTDANVTEGETVISPTNNKLWTKRGGTIRDAMGTTFV
ncbi:hypothetical protein [Dyadobacter sp. 22481]|uniref:hypothetical protein n=1 Tax=Dyadobacter sp. 22481 TaxID=3453926 RepID=UPI003F844744